MKNISIAIMMLLICTNGSFGQSKIAFGVAADAVLPAGMTSERYGAGYGVGALVIIPTSSTSVGIVLGGDYLSMPGKTTTETQIISFPGYYSSTTTTTQYEDLQFGSVYAGPKFDYAKGVYFLPAISINFAGETRFGFYFGGGILLPLESIKLNLGVKYGILNLLGKNEDEDSESGILIFAGIVF